MINDGQSTFPILSTVSRGWSSFGEIAYDKLMYQIQNPDARFVETYDSFFVPSESCGCEATELADKNRFNKIRNLYFDNLQKSIMDIFLQRLQIPISLATCKEDFYEKGLSAVRDIPTLGPNYCFCTEPEFFELNDDDYPRRRRGYSAKLDILYELKDNKKQPISHFNSRELYPGYKHEEGESNLYIFAPLNHLNYIMGYVAIKNTPDLLYSSGLYKYVSNMESLLFSMRGHIFTQRTNEELRRVYMNDALTGIYNRTGCEKVLYEYIEEQKAKNQRSILVFADIDRMKTINDVYGHLNGDFAIKATAEAFKKHSPNGWLFGRYGGDEFIAVGPCDNPENIPASIKKLSESMSAEFKSLNLSFMLHASIGYSVIEPEDEGSIDDYIDRADKSMYEEKEKIHRIMDSIQLNNL
jgi:diguanylate cyclase (GGDEF)-like protein